jgi:tRNA threonylcarbamoyladenosine biosynthesis protein TsaE
MTTFKSSSSEKTKEFGEALANRLSLIANRSTALVLALQGDLGAGKTTFTQGFFKGLGIKRRAVSPTFVIMRRYKIPANGKWQMANGKKRKNVGKKPFAIRHSPFANVFHFDAYRLKKAEDLEALEFGSILSNPKNITLIEWPERIKEIFPKNTVWLKFQYGKKENERKIIVGL